MSTQTEQPACHDHDPSIGRWEGLGDNLYRSTVHDLYGVAYMSDRSVIKYPVKFVRPGPLGRLVIDMRLVELANARDAGERAGRLFRARELVYDAAHYDLYPAKGGPTMARS